MTVMITVVVLFVLKMVRWCGVADETLKTHQPEELQIELFGTGAGVRLAALPALLR